MSFLLDTTVFIDLARGWPTTLQWWTRCNPTQLFVSSITVGELYRGAYLRHARNADALVEALRYLREDALAPLGDRVLPFDRAAAEIWGRLMGEGEARGRRPPPEDCKIAATALRHALTVATSNTRDLAGLCPVLDPRRTA